MGKLDGRVAIVTGAAQGIGAEFARGLAAEGAKLVIADLDTGASVVEEIKQAGGDATDVPTDVSTKDGCENMVAQAVEGFGRLDVLVNNAAIFTAVDRKNLDDIPVEEWDAVMGVNVRGVWLGCCAAVPRMRENGCGKIISISTGRVFKGTPYFLHYDASKAVVIGITRSLAREVGDSNICVNAIAPGSTMSENVVAWTNWKGGNADATMQTRAIKRREQPEDLVGACVFLASAESDFVTGQTLVVDGGSAMW